MAYTSIQSIIAQWVEERDLRQVTLSDQRDLAEKFSEVLQPFREFYRACAGQTDEDNLLEVAAAAADMEKRL